MLLSNKKNFTAAKKGTIKLSFPFLLNFMKSRFDRCVKNLSLLSLRYFFYLKFQISNLDKLD